MYRRSEEIWPWAETMWNTSSASVQQCKKYSFQTDCVYFHLRLSIEKRTWDKKKAWKDAHLPKISFSFLSKKCCYCCSVSLARQWFLFLTGYWSRYPMLWHPLGRDSQIPTLNSQPAPCKYWQEMWQQTSTIGECCWCLLSYVYLENRWTQLSVYIYQLLNSTFLSVCLAWCYFCGLCYYQNNSCTPWGSLQWQLVQLFGISFLV